MAANINGTAIPTSMVGRGRYLFQEPETLARNGQGAVVSGDYRSLTWTFPLLSYSDFAWWYSTLLSSNPSLIITACELYNALGNLTIYSHGVVLRPTYDFISYNYYNNVVVKIEDIA